jgi:cytokinesis protein
MKTLPPQVISQMLAYPALKKWTLIQSDARQEYQLERKRATIGPDGDKSAPEWYVRRIVDGSISLKELGSLAVSLRTQPIGWVKRFLETQGMVALIKVLSNLNSKGIKNENDVTHEYEIVKCLKTLLNNQVQSPHFGITTNPSSALTQPWITPQPYSPYLPRLYPHTSHHVKSSLKYLHSFAIGIAPTDTPQSLTEWTNSAYP